MSNLRIHVVLKRLLEERKVTSTQLSKVVGIPKSTISTWLLPTAKPTDVEQIQKVAKFFKISMSQLLFDEVESGNGLQAVQTELVLDGYYRLRLEKIITPKE